MKKQWYPLLSKFTNPPGTWEERQANDVAYALGLGHPIKNMFDKNKPAVDKGGYHWWHYWAYSGKNLESALLLSKHFKKEHWISGCSEHPWHVLIMEEHFHLYSKCVKYWGEPSAVQPTRKGCSIDHAIAWSGSKEWLKKIPVSALTTDVESDENGFCPLTIAIHRGGGEWIETWLARGSDPGCPDKQGKTPLHHAALYGNPEWFNILLDAGGDSNKKDNQGISASQIFKLREGRVEEKELISLREHWNRKRLQVLNFI